MAVQLTVTRYRDRNTPDPVFSLVDPDTPSGQQPVGVTGKTLVMSEEFNASALIDTDVANGYVQCRDTGPEWACWYPDWPRFDTQSPGGNHTNTNVTGYYQRNRVSLSAGNLVLDAVLDNPVSGLPYSLGMLQSLPGYTIAAGHFIEVRAKVAAMPNGTWPAAWTSCSDFNQWPPEIDYFEAPTAETTLFQNVYNNNSDPVFTQNTTVDMTAWHTYACDWQTNTVKFYLDGAVTATASRTLNTSQYLLLDMATFSGASFSSNSMLTDYIRVWQ